MTEANTVAVQPEVSEAAAAFMHEVRPIQNWHEWLHLAEAATTFEQKLGLLHVGFDMRLNRYEHNEPVYTLDDRLRFYFSVANGWTSARNFREEGLFRDEEPAYYINSRVERSQSEQRQILAQKAFDMLAKHYFKPRLTWLETADFRDRKERLSMREYLLDPTFQFVIDFFKPASEAVYNLSGYRDVRPSERLAVDFLLKLPKLLWGWEEDRINSYDSAEQKAKKEQGNSATRKVVAAGKLWIIEVLSELGELDLLTPWLVTDFDEPCVAKLEEIALRSKLWTHHHLVQKDRRVVTIDEACFAGSEAAWLLKKRELMVRENDRLQEIRSAERERDEADAKMRRLTGQSA